MAKAPVPKPAPAPARRKSASRPTFKLERAHPSPCCGVDEAGRGPWAGPVAAAAVILDPRRAPKGVNDSKVLNAAARESLEVEIKAVAIAWAVAFSDIEEIFTLNILHATGLAMRRAVEALTPQPAHALVDGNYAFLLPCPVKTVVKGDALCASIAAASILAKTARDRLMVHKGYHAPEHVEALRTLGPSPIHRRGWAPVRLALEGRTGELFPDTALGEADLSDAAARIAAE